MLYCKKCQSADFENAVVAVAVEPVVSGYGRMDSDWCLMAALILGSLVETVSWWLKNWEEWCWSWSSSSNTLATYCEEPDSLEKTQMLGKIEGRRKRGWQRMRWLDNIIDSMEMSLSRFQEIVKDGQAWCAAVHGVTKSWTRLSDWTTKTGVGTFGFVLGAPRCTGVCAYLSRGINRRGWVEVFNIYNDTTQMFRKQFYCSLFV